MNSNDIPSDSNYVGFGNFSDSTDSFHCDFDEGSSKSQSSYCHIHHQQKHKYPKHYRVPPLLLHTACTEKHNQRHPGIHIHFDRDGDNVLAPETYVLDNEDSVDSGGDQV